MHCLFQEALENLEGHHILDIENDGKLHVLYGGTKVVQHTPPSKTGPGMKSKHSTIILYMYKVKFNQNKLLHDDFTQYSNFINMFNYIFIMISV